MNSAQPAIRPITTDGFAAVAAPADFGSAAMLQWIPITEMVVDPSYQREITGSGRGTIRKIVAEFSWSKFAPVIVSPVPGGKYAIVDGQHRTTAAALCGLDQVPCAVILVDLKGQAAAFRAINSVTTKMSPMAMFHAAVLAGDTEAAAIKEACDCAGVTILRYPIATSDQKPGQTMAASAVERMFKRHGRDTLITALQCVTQTGDENVGLLIAPVITALCEVLSEQQEWRDAGSALFDIFDKIDLALQLDRARTVSARGDIGVATALANQLREILARKLPISVPEVKS